LVYTWADIDGQMYRWVDGQTGRLMDLQTSDDKWAHEQADRKADR